MTDPKKIAEIHARTRPSAAVRDNSPIPEEEWDDRSLALGGRVGEFEITGIIGKGGFGIVYLAWDHSLERVVALKEYMPASFASRTNRTQVNPLSERHRETFQMGMSSFVNEAKLLAQFHSPSLVEVHRFWEANGTAYMVMPYYRGLTLGETVKSLSEPPSEAWLLDLLAPLTEALLELHSVHCYHRDVAPDNILILADTGSPLLLDFGAARRVIVGQAHALTIILKAGYAPIEQYGDVPGMQQGPWTDVYALASVVYWAVTGKTPPPATARMIRDSYVPLAQCAPAQYSRSFASAIDRALAVLPEGRTESILQLRGELGLSPLSVRRPPAMQWEDSDATVLQVAPTRAPAAQMPPQTAPQAVATPGQPHGSDPAQPLSAAVPARRVRQLAAGMGALGLLIAAAGATWLMRSPDKVAPPVAGVARPSASAPVAPPAVTPAVTPALPPTAPLVAEPVPVPQSAEDALALIVARQDSALALHAEVGATTMQGGIAKRTVSYTSSAPGHLYLIGVHAGVDELTLVLPAPGTAPARSGARGKISLPVDAMKPGAWKFALVLAQEPLELGPLGWQIEGKAWKRPFASPAMKSALPWAIPACSPGAPCVAGYGAGAFALTVDAAPMVAVEKVPVRKAEKAAPPPHPAPERAAPKNARVAANPECEKILMRMSLGEAGQDLIDRMKTLKCN